MLKSRNPRSGFLDCDQIDRICAALKATETADDGRKKAGELPNVVLFAFVTGWRTAPEVLPLEWRHVDWYGRCVRLDAHTTRIDEGRVLPFTADIETVLTEQLTIHKQLATDGTICPSCFTGTARGSATSAPRGRTPARPPALGIYSANGSALISVNTPDLAMKGSAVSL